MLDPRCYGKSTGPIGDRGATVNDGVRALFDCYWREGWSRGHASGRVRVLAGRWRGLRLGPPCLCWNALDEEPVDVVVFRPIFFPRREQVTGLDTPRESRGPIPRPWTGEPRTWTRKRMLETGGPLYAYRDGVLCVVNQKAVPPVDRIQLLRRWTACLRSRSAVNAVHRG